MKLPEYLSAQFAQDTIPHILFSTNLKPDDVIGIYALAAELNTHDKPVHITFLVGEGHSGIKVLRMRSLINEMRKQGVLKDKVVTAVLQGYGSSKTLPLDGLESFDSQEALQAALTEEKLAEGLTTEEHRKTLAELIEIFSAHPDMYIFNVKPPREFIDLANDEKTVKVLRRAIFLGTFGFNVQSLLAEMTEQTKSEKEAVSRVLNFLRAFSVLYYFESFFALGSKDRFNKEECPNLFSGLEQTALGRALVQLIKNYPVSTGSEFIATEVVGVLAGLGNDLGLAPLTLSVSFNSTFSIALSEHPMPGDLSASVQVFVPNNSKQPSTARDFINYLRLLEDKAGYEQSGGVTSAAAALALADIQKHLTALPFSALQHTAYKKAVEEIFRRLSSINVLPADDRVLRISTVNDQAKIEEDIIASSELATAVFCVPTPLTPLYIAKEEIFLDKTDGLYKIRNAELIPNGLIPEDKLNDPKQLSTVLRRVLTIHGMLEKGMKVVVLCKALDRPSLTDKQKMVVDSALKMAQAQYPDQLILRKIEKIPDNINAANYFLASGQDTTISAGQMGHAIASGDNWGVHPKSIDYRQAVNAMLGQVGLEEVDALITQCTSSQSHLPGYGGPA